MAGELADITGDHSLTVIYDGECPFCSNFAQRLRLIESVGEILLVDARSNAAAVDRLTAAGHDINEGMVVIHRDQIHHGDDAMHVLALLSTRSDLFNRFNAWIFASPGRAKWLYPVFRGCRNAALRLLGRSKIDR